MSLITCCPFCGTRFRVVPDQLKMAEGWVRCGHCSEVFDAQLSLQEVQALQPVAAPAAAAVPAPDAPPESGFAFPTESPPAIPPSVQAEPEPGQVPVPACTQEAAPVPSPVPEALSGAGHGAGDEPGEEEGDQTVLADLQPLAAVSRSAAPTLADEAGEILDPADLPRPILSVDIELELDPPLLAGGERTGSDSEPLAEGEPVESFVLDEDPRREPVLDFVLPDDPLPPLESFDAVAEPDESQAAQSAPTLAAADTEIAPAGALPADAADLGFLRQARRRAFWARPGVRMALASSLVLLSVLLAGQVAYQQRDALVQQVPALQPTFQALCQSLGCRVGPPQRIESVVIDGSSFTRLRPDAYRLSLTLANHASLPVAMPALELTLTDTQDQPVLRRVLLPPDLGSGTPATIAANGEWATTLTLAVTPNASTGRIVGYRLLAFYP